MEEKPPSYPTVPTAPDRGRAPVAFPRTGIAESSTRGTPDGRSSSALGRIGRRDATATASRILLCLAPAATAAMGKQDQS